MKVFETVAVNWDIPSLHEAVRELELQNLSFLSCMNKTLGFGGYW